MKIEIRQDPIALGDQYSIAVDGADHYRASSRLLRLLHEVQLKNLQGESILTIKRQFSLLYPKYDITTHTSGIFNFRADSWWRPIYRCDGPSGNYRIYGHRGLKHSVFKGDQQIALIDKNRVKVGEGDVFMVMADDNVEAELLSAIVLIIDYIDHSDESSTVTLDFGNLIQGKQLDKQWRPSSRHDA